MRPVEFSEQVIIEAGKELLASGRNVTGFALRQRVGGGSAPRLKQVWDDHLAQTHNTPDMPADLTEELAKVSSSLAHQLRQFVGMLHGRILDSTQQAVIKERERATAEIEEAQASLERLEAQRDDALNQAQSLATKLEQERLRAQELAVESALLKERLSAAEALERLNSARHEAALTQLRGELAAARLQSDEARDEVARLQGQIKAIEKSNATLMAALTPRPSS